MVGTAGLLLLSHKSLDQIIDKLDSTLDIDPIGPWTLDHRSFIETIQPGLSPGEKQSRKWLQILTLSYHPGEDTYVIITHPVNSGGEDGSKDHLESPSNAIRIPTSQSPNFNALLSEKFTPMWTPYDHHTVLSGQTFDAGEYRIRVGEIARSQYRGQHRGGAGSQDSGWVSMKDAQGGMVVLNVEVVSEGQNKEDGNVKDRVEEGVGIEAEMIRKLYEKLGFSVEEGAGSMTVEMAAGSSEEARRWCDVLKVHGRGIRTVAVKTEER